jgi:heme a synthase
MGLIGLQVCLGIATLLGFGIWTPPKVQGVMLGIGHQALGAILFTTTLLWLRASLSGPKQLGLKLVKTQ